MRHHLQAIFLEGQVAVGVEQVGLILVDQVGHAVEIVLPPGIGNAVVVPVQLVNERRAACVVIEVGVLRIGAVIRNAGQWPGLVGAVAHGKPLVTDPKVLADAEAQAVTCARLSATVPTTSFFGPMFTAFQRVYFEFHRSKLSWCTPMLKKYFAPAFL